MLRLLGVRMSALGVLQYVLWFLGPAMQAAILVVMIRKGLRRDYPLFFSYLILEVATFFVLFGVFHLAYSQYFYAYWSVTSLTSILGFAAIYEAFRGALKGYAALREMAGILFRWVLVLMVVIGLMIAITSEGNKANQVVAGVLSFDRSVRLMQCGLVLFLVLFARHLKLSFRSHGFAIAAGFGISSAVELVLVTLRTHYGYMSDGSISLINSLAYASVLVLWLQALHAPEEVPQTSAAGDATAWNLALSAPSSDARDEEAFLPYLEKTVERVLARRRINIVQ